MEDLKLQANVKVRRDPMRSHLKAANADEHHYNFTMAGLCTYDVRQANLRRKKFINFDSPTAFGFDAARRWHIASAAGRSDEPKISALQHFQDILYRSGGRGRKPGWVTEALAAGKSLSDFENS